MKIVALLLPICFSDNGKAELFWYGIFNIEFLWAWYKNNGLSLMIINSSYIEKIFESNEV